MDMTERVTTGNPIRDQIIVAAWNRIAQRGDSISHAAVAAQIELIYPGFDFGEDEFDQFFTSARQQAEEIIKTGNEPVPDEEEVVDFTVAAPVVAPPVEQVVAEPEFSRDTVLQAIREATVELHTARHDVMRLTREANQARIEVANAVQAWQRQGVPAPRDRVELVKQELEAQRRYKAMVASGEIAPRQRPRVANSAIDRSAAYSRDESAAGYARGNNHLVTIYDGMGGSRQVMPTKGWKRGGMTQAELQAQQARQGEVWPTQGQTRDGQVGPIIPAPSREAALKAGAQGRGMRGKT